MIYLLNGETGEYSDRRDWNVKAFSSKESADAICEKLNQWCRDNNCSGDCRHDSPRKSISKYPNNCPLDPDFDCDYTGTEYYVLEVEYE